MSWTEVWVPLGLSLKVACCALLISGLLGVVLGFVLSRTRHWLGHVADSLCTLPMVLPPAVLGYYLLVIFGGHGVLGEWLNDVLGIRLVFSWQGAVVAAAVVSFPLAFKPARAAFESVDARLEQAGRVLGVSELGIALRISLPLAWRGILAGLVLGFVRALGEFGATLMLAGSIPGKTQTLSIAIYEAVQAGRDGQAHALALLISVVCVLMLWLATWLSADQRRGARG